MSATHDDFDDDDAESTPGDRRQLKNFFVKPRYQLQYVNWFIFGAFASLVTTVGLIHYRLRDVDHLLNSSADATATSQIPVYHAFSDITMIALAGFVVFTLFACGLAILINHRVSGPMIALVACLEGLKQGKYTDIRPLRNNDELTPIHDAIADLGRHLRAQQGTDHAEPVD
ncbi:MAG: hypothetical protein AAF541_03305 [Pseudomonadota bacterium]